MFKRVLIANRGEIAIRIARAAAALSLESVSIHSAADARALHTRMTTGSRLVGHGQSDPIQPYLDIPMLVATAQEAGCDCIHPGYGFLAESAAFAAYCDFSV